MKLKIGTSDALNASELASPNGWIPLEYRFFNRRITGNSVAYFPDLATYIDAYLASDPNTKVFTISQPRYKTTNKLTSAVLTFDQTFFNNYLPALETFDLRFDHSDVYAQLIDVHIFESLTMVMTSV